MESRRSRKRERENPCFICSHFHNFEAGEPCSVCGHGPAPACEAAAAGGPTGAIPTEVVPDFLYLGSYDHASRAELLKAMGIRRILNTVPECQNLYRNTFAYHTASAVAGAPKQVPLDECVAFLDDSLAAGDKVLVHCISASVVLAYLIHRQKWRLAHAHAWLRERRPSVALQPAAAEQLAAYELAVLGDVARDPPPPTPAHNPLPRNDAPFGVPPERQAPVGGPAPLLHHGGGGAGAAAGAGAGAAASMPFGSPLALGEAALPPQHHGWMGPG